MKRAIITLVLISAAGCEKREPTATPPSGSEAAKPLTMNADLLATPAPAGLLANELVEFEPASGHHFELKAPQSCGEFEPTDKTARKITCQLGAPGVHKITLNVCDDAKQYCKPVRFEVTATAPHGWVADGEAKTVRQPPKHQHPGVKGFIVNQPDEAQAQAKKDGKPLFVHFFGIWCPPCNMLEEYVYTTPEFLEATDGMVRVMLDADSDLSWDWKAKFKVGGYPTVVIATPELLEIDRLVGSRPAASVVKWVNEAQEHRDTPIEGLLNVHKSPAAAPDDVRKRIGEYHAARREWTDAAKWLADHPEPQARITWINAERELARADGDEVKALQLTQQLVREFPDHIKFSSWVKELLEKKSPGAGELVEPAYTNLESWKKSDGLDDTGYSVAGVWWMQADLHAAAGNEEAAKAAYREAAALYGELAKSSSLEVARGANMDRAYALHKAGENVAAKALYEELAAAYAKEFSFNYNYAHVLNELGEPDLAYEYVKKAEEHSYGDNWLRAVHLRAKIEHALGKTDEARKTIDAALGEAIVPRSTDVRTHRYLKRLRDLRAELST